MPDDNLTEIQREVLVSLKDSYARYNSLMTRILDVVNRDYTSMYAIKRAILDSLSESLHEVSNDDNTTPFNRGRGI